MAPASATVWLRRRYNSNGTVISRRFAMDYWNAELRTRVRAMIPEVEGKPCVNVGGYDGGVYVCRRISGVATDEDSLNGTCDWVDLADARPDELTDGMAISCDCVRIGPGWWQDMYFGWYFVYDPALVGRSLAGDHSWVASFLASAGGPTADPNAEGMED
jgi:hypothetical protein